MGQGYQAYLLNLRRPLFQDRRVRQALDYTYDFEKINLYKPAHARLQPVLQLRLRRARACPSPGELALLEPFRAQLPPEVFGLPYEPPRTDTGPNALRENLKKARDAARAGGLEHRRRRRAAQRQGRAVRVRVSRDPEAARSSATSIWQRNLAKVGITMRVRTVDFALYRKRLEAFDFDVVTIRTPDFAIPSAVDYSELFELEDGRRDRAPATSAASRIPAVDAMLIEAMGDAKTLRRAARRGARARPHRHAQPLPGAAAVLRRGYFMSYWNKFGIPTRCRSTTRPTSPPIWPHGRHRTWWIKDPAARAPQARHDAHDARATSLKRLLLMIPTLLGVLTVTFIVIQFVPGGPVDQLVAEMRARQRGEGARSAAAGRRDLDAKQIEEIKKLYGFDKPPLTRYVEMLGSFARFDLGRSFMHNKDVWQLIKEKLPVSISLGLWTFLLTYLISIPLGRREGGARRVALRHARPRCSC